MKSLKQYEEDIRTQMLGMYYRTWTQALTDDMKNRKLYITPVQGQYDMGAGFMFVIEGTPPRGMIYFFPELHTMMYSNGGSWRPLVAKKYYDMRHALNEWHIAYAKEPKPCK